MLHIAQRFNHSKVLNAISNNHLGQMSVLIKCCQHGNTSNGSAPVISFNIPNNVFYLSKPPAVVPIMPVQGTTPSLVTPIAHTPPQPSVTETLVSTDHVSGPKLPLEEFCRMYHLNDGVQNKFDEDGYSGTHPQNGRISEKQGWKLVRSHSLSMLFCMAACMSWLIPMDPCTFLIG